MTVPMFVVRIEYQDGSNSIIQQAIPIGKPLPLDASKPIKSITLYDTIESAAPGNNVGDAWARHIGGST